MKTSNITIRRAAIEDLPLVRNLNSALYMSEIDNGHDDLLDPTWPQSEEGSLYYQKSITDPQRVTFIAEIDGTPVGYLIGAAVLRQSDRTAVVGELENMFVDSAARHKGVGAALVAALKKWLKEKGTERMIVKLYSKNTGSHAFYKSVGFYDWGIEMEMVL